MKYSLPYNSHISKLELLPEVWPLWLLRDVAKFEICKLFSMALTSWDLPPSSVLRIESIQQFGHVVRFSSIGRQSGTCPLTGERSLVEWTGSSLGLVGNYRPCTVEGCEHCHPFYTLWLPGGDTAPHAPQWAFIWALVLWGGPTCWELALKLPFSRCIPRLQWCPPLWWWQSFLPQQPHIDFSRLSGSWCALPLLTTVVFDPWGKGVDCLWNSATAPTLVLPTQLWCLQTAGIWNIQIGAAGLL